MDEEEEFVCLPITFIAFFICKERAWDAPGFQWLWSAVTLTVLQNEHDAVRCDVTPEAAVPHDHNLFSAACVGGFVIAFRHCLVLKRESPSHAAAAMVLTLRSHFPLTFSRRFHPPATYRRVSTRGFRSWSRARFTDGQHGGSESLSRGFLRIGINLFV